MISKELEAKLGPVPADVMYPDAYRLGQLQVLLEIEQRKSADLRRQLESANACIERLHEGMYHVAR